MFPILDYYALRKPEMLAEAFGRGGSNSDRKTGGFMHYRDEHNEVQPEPLPDEGRSSRRLFLSQLAALSASLTIAAPAARAASSKERTKAETTDPERSESLVDIVLKVNGREAPLKVDSRVTLLDAVRDRLNMSGTKKGCDHGACGACTVLIDGKRVLSCLTLAVMAQGKEITTIEGLAHGDELHPVQAAFVACDGFQCGYCTPGQIMSAVGCIYEGHTHSDSEIREFMSGNLCRCGAYPNIVEAIKQAATQMKGGVS
jgi:xanthine dehydrogenase YagT iron-sulfur-binding subunit